MDIKREVGLFENKNMPIEQISNYFIPILGIDRINIQFQIQFKINI